MQGAFFLACSNKSLTLAAPAPTKSSTNSEPEIIKKGTSASPATALESKGVEFAAAPPKKPNIFSTILSWVVPPLIFILVLQFFARRSMGGGGAQGALSFTKSKAKVYVPDDESKVTFADVA